MSRRLFVSEMDVLLGSRYCEPTKVSAPQKIQ